MNVRKDEGDALDAFFEGDLGGHVGLAVPGRGWLTRLISGILDVLTYKGLMEQVR